MRWSRASASLGKMTGPVIRKWPLNIPIRLDRRLRMPIYQQLARQLGDEIRRGRLSPGTALPGTRELAAELAINRKTVVIAYDELIAQGWLTADPMRGTFVSSDLPEPSPGSTLIHDAQQPVKRDYAIADDLGNVPLVIGGPAARSFDDGLPDTRLVPAEILGRAYRSAIQQAARQNRLHYGDPRGHLGLREAISRLLNADRGLATTTDNICLTRGSQMGIFLAARVLTRPGDNVALEAATYPPARLSFTTAGVNVVAVRVDKQGLDVDHLEEICRKTRISAIYLTPHHHFPTTVILPPERRLRLLSIAEQYRFSIIEDDYDHEYNFDFKPLLPMASFAPGKIIYIGSFSKILSPNLRLGYIVAPKEVIDAFAKQIALVDRQGDQVTEMAVAEMIDAGELARHSRRALAIYKGRRDAFASLLRAHFGDLARFDVPIGGLAFWIQFRDSALLQHLEARAHTKGFRLLVSESFRICDFAPHGLRLGFASKNNQEMSEAITALRGLLGESLPRLGIAD
jgi:GntR family transcriptional regulator / MocR family aminotransferase